MSNLLIEDRNIVTPGEEIANGMDYLPSHGTYRDADSIVAKQTGLLKVEGKVLRIVPLSGEYLPKRGDTVIAQVEDVTMSSWIVSLFGPYGAMLGLKEGTQEFVRKGEDLTKYYAVGDYIVCKIVNVTSQKLVDVSTRGPGLRKLNEGRVFRVSSSKVPRIIGKQGSMVTLVKDHTKTQITVGQNGMVWIKGEEFALENLAEKAIRKIEAEAHTSGLTDTMEAWLKEQVGGQ